jgi:hypothetical protein
MVAGFFYYQKIHKKTPHLVGVAFRQMQLSKLLIKSDQLALGS